MTFRIDASKPRNPFVAAARRRAAGAHRASTGSQRQAGRRELQRHLSLLAHPRHAP